MLKSPFLSSAKIIPLCDQHKRGGAGGVAGRQWLPWLRLGQESGDPNDSCMTKLDLDLPGANGPQKVRGVEFRGVPALRSSRGGPPIYPGKEGPYGALLGPYVRCAVG